MSKTVRSRVANTPVVGYAARLGANIIKLTEKLSLLNHRVDEIEKSKEKENSTIFKSLEEANEHILALERRVASLSVRVAESPNRQQQQIPKSSKSSQLFSDNHSLDQFYLEFENRFRGTEKEIEQKLIHYVKTIKKTGLNTEELPIVDIGCGRGELLGIFKANGLNAIGVDLNEDMVKHVNASGLKAVLADALTYLAKQKTGSLSAVTGFHIVEHIPFQVLYELFAEVHRVLAPGGIAIFETPNPENIIVGSCNFYNDPSHLRPIPPAVLQFTLETRGFEKVVIQRLHPMRKIEHSDPLVAEIANHVYGPQDYAVVAIKS